MIDIALLVKRVEELEARVRFLEAQPLPHEHPWTVIGEHCYCGKPSDSWDWFESMYA